MAEQQSPAAPAQRIAWSWSKKGVDALRHLADHFGNPSPGDDFTEAHLAKMRAMEPDGCSRSRLDLYAVAGRGLIGRRPVPSARKPALPRGDVAQLAQELVQLREEVAAMRRILQAAGPQVKQLLQASVHRQRFEALLGASGWRGDTLLPDALEVSSVARVCRSMLGLPAALELRASSRALQCATDHVSAKIYVFGGQGDEMAFMKTWECLDLATGTWEKLPGLKFGLFSSATVVLEGQVYVFGGGGEFGNISQRFCPRRGTWQLLPPMSVRRCGPCAVALYGCIYVCGGHIWETSTATAECFVPSAGPRGAWVPVASMLKARNHFVMAVLSGCIVACGGLVFPGGTLHSCKSCTDSTEVYNPLTSTWELAHPMLEKRGAFGGAILAGALYICGGNGPGPGGELRRRHPLASAERLGIAGGHWEALPPMAEPRDVFAAVAVGGRLYCLGGATRQMIFTDKVPDETRLRKVSLFDPKRGAWEPVPGMVERRFGCCVASLPA